METSAYDDEPLQFRGALWLWDGDAAWHFITVPEDLSDAIDFRAAGQSRGFGSVRVEVTVGATTWRTSLFPDSKRGAYVLPVRKPVRDREGLAVGDEADVVLRLLLDD